jgi:hypothetical protein
MLSFGGWQQLATHYRATTLPLTANTSTLGYAKVGWVSYKNILRAGACSEGLVLKVFFLFRFFHPPLLIPWHVLDSVQTHRGFWNTTYSLTIPTSDGTSEVLQFTSDSLLATLRPWLRVAATQ